MQETRFVDWSKWDAKLGKIHDGWIAQRVGVTPQAVSYRRRRLGIEPFGFSASVEALRAALLRALKASTRKAPVLVRDIHAAVVKDYGTVSFRTIQRHLKRMVVMGQVVAVREPDASASDWGYALKRGGR